MSYLRWSTLIPESRTSLALEAEMSRMKSAEGADVSSWLKGRGLQVSDWYVWTPGGHPPKLAVWWSGHCDHDGESFLTENDVRRVLEGTVVLEGLKDADPVQLGALFSALNCWLMDVGHHREVLAAVECPDMPPYGRISKVALRFMSPRRWNEVVTLDREGGEVVAASFDDPGAAMSHARSLSWIAGVQCDDGECSSLVPGDHPAKNWLAGSRTYLSRLALDEAVEV